MSLCRWRCYLEVMKILSSLAQASLLWTAVRNTGSARNNVKKLGATPITKEVAPKLLIFRDFWLLLNSGLSGSNVCPVDRCFPMFCKQSENVLPINYFSYLKSLLIANFSAKVIQKKEITKENWLFFVQTILWLYLFTIPISSHYHRDRSSGGSCHHRCRYSRPWWNPPCRNRGTTPC